MNRIRYYTYLETLKKLAGDCALFGYNERDKVRILYERLERIRKVCGTDGELPDPENKHDAEELYTYLSLLLAGLKENFKR